MTQEFLELIKTRRSVRRYTEKDVDLKFLSKVFEAARWAPSAHNSQPWRFIIINDSMIKRRLAESMAMEWDKALMRDGVPYEIRRSLIKDSIARFTAAPVLIIACITMSGMDHYPDEERKRCEHIMATQSLGAAIQNILLLAHSEGLGSCWYCAPLFSQDTVRKVLGIPPDVEPQAVITIGYPAEWPTPPTRKKLEEFVFINSWGRGMCSRL
ncbi:MAG: nitroreductase family protein [Nitrososphaerota archaeon]|nr:nitroreductase family protein [Candidatus Bathyarchaeota archaeon]MDW8048415.1 nitroreductase family protein [Nitrososphaerota archaeon]